MDVLAYRRAMAAFCRQRAQFAGENSVFWIKLAEEWDDLIFEGVTLQPQLRTGQATWQERSS